MCAKHWAMVPTFTKESVYREYRNGQCNKGTPSVQWMEAANSAIYAVRLKELNIIVKEKSERIVELEKLVIACRDVNHGDYYEIPSDDWEALNAALSININKG